MQTNKTARMQMERSIGKGVSYVNHNLDYLTYINTGKSETPTHKGLVQI